jgi:hypothetical protein
MSNNIEKARILLDVANMKVAYIIDGNAKSDPRLTGIRTDAKDLNNVRTYEVSVFTTDEKKEFASEIKELLKEKS